MNANATSRTWLDRIGDAIDKIDVVVTKLWWLACTCLAVSYVVAMIRAVWRI